ncbi:uncharacterized proline-rich protein-like [Rhodamnia argentea]|uniref:Uncharacterized proline-rich protein-like n=1 Tax=Rhodamnia argentea TaxID=178133 RepID=A0A8B8P6I0_9MYRT|nr:uncharacterized proline-rich protein-like [Rhodamnia argentea]
MVHSSFRQLIFLVLFLAVSLSNGDSTVPRETEPDKTTGTFHATKSGIKCSTCTCSDPCGQQQSLPPPPPPPPRPPPPPLPPPPPRFIYVTGMPGNLYSSDTNDDWHYYYSGASRNRVAGYNELVLLVGFGILGAVATW